MKNILVTGGCGFIGSNFIHLIFERMNNIRVINLDALTYAGNLHNLDALSDNPDYIFIKGSICDKVLTARIFSEYDID
ncbi:MAG: GDP-mannose 4,6-dehydratase, partial [Candidatus Muiribacteriaceae bacterium]